MKKKILYSIILPLVFFSGGCTDVQTKHVGLSNQTNTAVDNTVYSRPTEDDLGTDIGQSNRRVLILNTITEIISETMESERKEDWLATIADFEEFGLAGLDDDDVLAFCQTNNREVLNLFLSLKGKDSDFDDYIDNVKAKIDLVKAKEDNEFVCNLPGMDCGKE